MAMNRVQKIGVDMFTIDDFLSDFECQELIKLIDIDARRSTTATQDPNKFAEVIENRTSYTSDLHENKSLIISDINTRMSSILNIPLSKAEALQGQRYEVGQQFKDHFDWFDGKNFFTYLKDQGNRTYTFMVYLNDDLEGGETEFPKLDIKYKPKKGMAVLWKNLQDDGSGNRLVLHAGRPVTKGKKYILTKWFRQFDIGRVPEDYMKKIMPTTASALGDLKEGQKSFSSIQEIPRFDRVGFKVEKVPSTTFALIREAYELLKNVKVEEANAEPGNSGCLQNKNGEHATEMLSMDHFPTLRSLIHDQLLKKHEEWIKEPLTKSFIYGIRSYKNGSFLKSHVDRIATHHISSIIIVDKKGEKDWPLDIQDHKGNWHKIYAEVGDMIMYESAVCEHGRTTPYEGEYFRNLFVHYKLKNWVFVDKNNG